MFTMIDFTSQIDEKLKKRFWAKVDKRGGCWLWRASIANHYGYGQFAVGDKIFSAHRVAWVIEHGRMPNGLLLHSCDNAPCVKPAHLREGTHKDNTQDMISRGRAGYTKIIGENNGNVKLKDYQVREILEKYSKEKANAPALAKEYGITPSLIYMILHGKRRRYITGVQTHTPDGNPVTLGLDGAGVTG